MKSSARTLPSTGFISIRAPTTPPPWPACGVVAAYPGVFRDVPDLPQRAHEDVLSGAQGPSWCASLHRFFDAAQRGGSDRGGLADLPGVVDLKVEPQIVVPQVEVRIRSEQAALHGLSAAAIQRAASTIISGTQVAELYDTPVPTPVVVWGEPGLRSDITALRRLRIATPHGIDVPLHDVAEVAIVAAPSEIKRESGSRRIDVTCNVRGKDIGSVARAVEARVGNTAFHAAITPSCSANFRPASALASSLSCGRSSRSWAAWACFISTSAACA